MQPDSRPGFVHLHLHSEYSLLDGGNRLAHLVARVKELGMPAVALTDHGNLFGAIEFYSECQAAGIKPILGIEAYVAPDARSAVSDRRRKEAQGVADGGFHLVLLAEDETGWRNLVRLSSDSFLEGFYYRPRMDKSTLEQWHQGLIAINGHLGSSLAYYLRQLVETGSQEYWGKAVAEARWHAGVFGAGPSGPRFYLELQRHDTREQDEINPLIVKLARELELPLVCDNDAHFLRAEDWDHHDTLVCVSTGKAKDDRDRLRYPHELYVKAPEQMAERFADLAEALDNTVKIAERCDVRLEFGRNHAPLVRVRRRPQVEPASAARVGSTEWYRQVCSGFELVPVSAHGGGGERFDPDTAKEECDHALDQLAQAGLRWRYGQAVTEEHTARLQRELRVLADKGISAYFLIVWDFVNEARNRGIPAMARGSGVGTMVGYCLGLSNACPVRYGLLFERFTDPDRSEYPDIDVDLCQDGRQEILDYVRDKYGYVAQIITFGTMKARAAVRDVGRVLNLPLPEVDKICKLIGDQLGITLDEAQANEPELKAMLRRPEVRAVYDSARALEGMVRHSGVHAAGVVIATQPLQELVPLAISKQQNQKEILVTQWDGPTVERMGLLKMDFLGLKTLSVLERARRLVRESLTPAAIAAAVPGDHGESDPLDLDRIDFGDQNVLDLYRRGETAGTFQFESEGMRNLLLKMSPDRLEDLVAANALFRPGPMALIDEYCERKLGRKKVPQVHEVVERYTAETYGIMVYQEQVMQIAHGLGGIPLREAYSLIKAISKKKSETINAARERFVAGALERGLAKVKADELFDLILRFAGYGFNKSHSVGYSILAFQTAFMKTYFPVQFMAAVLSYESDNTDKLAFYLGECKRVRMPNGGRGIDVRPPDINLSGESFQVVYEPGEAHDPSSGHVRFGLFAVKGVGQKAVEAILLARAAGGPFKSLFELCERVSLQIVNRATLESLIKAGAFDSLHGTERRAALVRALDGAMQRGQRAAADRESGQAGLFAAMPAQGAEPEERLPDEPPYTLMEQLQHEKAALGFFATRHPLDEHRQTLQRLSNTGAAEFLELPDDADVTVGAMIQSLRFVRAKKGKSAGQRMAILQLVDGADTRFEAVVFAETYAQIHALLQEDAILFFRGKVDRRREEPSLQVSHVIALDQAPSKLTKRVLIELRDGGGLRELGEAERAALDDFLMRLRELLDGEKNRVNGSAAEVEFRVRLADSVVVVSASGVRIPVDQGLPARIERFLGRRGSCELVGPERLRPRSTAGAPAGP